MQKTTKITIEKSSYIVKFPTVGEFLEIENMKMALTQGRYTDLLLSNLKSSSMAVKLVDAISHFSVLIPDLRKDLNFKSFAEVDAIKAKELVKVYEKQFLVWYQPLFDELVKQDDKEEDKEEDDEESGNALSLE